MKALLLITRPLAPLAALPAGEMDRVELEVKQTGAEIPPLLFGHNRKQTRGAQGGRCGTRSRMTQLCGACSVYAACTTLDVPLIIR